MTEQVAKKRGRPAKRKLTDISFDHEGAHLALVSKELNSGPANLQDYALLLRGIESYSADIIEKASQVQVTLSIEEFLAKFFGLYYVDAEVLARAMGYTTSAMDEAAEELMEDESEDDDPYEDYIQRRLSSFSIMKAMQEQSSESAMANLTGEQYLQLLQDQQELEKAFTDIAAIKQASKVMVKKESDLKANASQSDTQQNASVEKAAEQAAKVESLDSVQKVNKGNYMADKEVKTVVADVEKELVEKSVLVELQKAMQDQKEELNKALELVKQFEQEKKDAITKARKEKLGNVVKNQEQAGALFKAADLLEEADFEAFVKAVAGIQAIADQSDLFKSVGADGTVEQKSDDADDINTLLIARLEAGKKK